MDERLARADQAYERSVFGGDGTDLAAAERDLNGLEADLALARGRLLHARFLTDRVEDPAELALFTHAAELFTEPRGRGEALFWVGIVHQVIRNDTATARPFFEEARKLADQAGDRRTLSYVYRHLGFDAQQAGRLDEARAYLTRSTELRRELGFDAGVAANLLALAHLSAAEGRPDEARAILAEATATAKACGADGVLRFIDQAEI